MRGFGVWAPMDEALAHPNPVGIGIAAVPGGDRIPSARRHVLTIEGVGEHYAAQLKSLGITTIGHLWTADPTKISHALDVPEGVVQNWRAMGELMDITGIGPQFSELLVRCGIRTVKELSACDPKELMARVLVTSAEREVRIQGAPLGLKHMERWVRAAREYLSPTV